MKGSRCQALIRKHLLPFISGFRVKGKLLYASPVSNLLRGCYFEDSGFDPNRFTAWAFVQPLYVPSSCLVFTLGERLGAINGGQERWWNLNEASDAVIMGEVLDRVRNEAEPSFLHIEDAPAALIGWLRGHSAGAATPFGLESLAYSYAFSGQTGDAQKTLDRLDAILKQIGTDWSLEEISHSNQLRAAISAGREPTLELLNQWADATARSIGIQRESTLEGQHALSLPPVPPRNV